MNTFKKIAFICLLLSAGEVHAQSLERAVIGTLGGSATGGGSAPQLMYNMGEVSTSTLTGGGNVLTQGFEQPASSLLPITGTLAVCAGSNTSLADATAGGTWSSGNTSIATIGSIGIVMGIAAGTATISYSVSGNVTTANVTVNALPVPATVTSPALCYGGSTGSVTVSATGGLAPYRGTGTFTGLVAGVHVYTIADANSCAATASATVSAPAAIGASFTTTSAACGGTGGSATATVSGGTPGYAYLWSNGATTSGISGTSAGTYSVTVTDAHSCVLNSVATIPASPQTVTVKLVNSTGAGIAGGVVQYYNGAWLSMGTTDISGNVCMSFPIPTFASSFTTYFRVLYAGGEKDWSGIAVASSPVLIATTTNVALSLMDHTGTLITSASGIGGYYNGTWVTLGSTGTAGYVSKELLPGSYYFNMGFNNYTAQQYVSIGSGPGQSVNFQTALVTLNLLDHTGAPITSSSGTGGYYTSSWYTVGSTGTTGKVSIELLPGSGYYFNMNYHNYTQQQAVTVTSAPLQNVNFQTSMVTLNLLDHAGVPITSSSGTGGYYSGGWYTLGTTGSTGSVSIELLPGSGYYFNMNYHNYTQQQAVTVTSAPVQNVNFQTTLVALNLLDHTGAAITSSSGTGGYYSGGWYTMGSTGSTGSVSMELLSGAGYYFNMNYHNYTLQQAVTVTSAPTQNVNFQTTLVTLNLLDHTGALITSSSGTGGYYSGSWYSLGSTGTTGSVSMELFPGTGYYFNMNYHNYTQQQAVTVTGGPSQSVNFQTTLVTLNLLDHTGALITAESGTGGYYSGGWYTMGGTRGTGSVSTELLSGSGYYFNMSYHNYTQQQPAIVTAGPLQTITFRTTLVTLSLVDHSGTPITAGSGTGGYYSGGWFTMGSTGGTGSISTELLPGSGYYFNMNYHNGTQQIGAMAVNSEPGIQVVTFQTALVKIHYQTIAGSALPGGAIGYYSGGWYAFGMTDGSGNTSMEMLPVPYYYNAVLAGPPVMVGPFTDPAASMPIHIIVASGVAAKSGSTDTTSADQVNVVASPEDKVNVYPNPTDGTFSVVIPAAQASAYIEITDATGRQMQSRAVKDNKGQPEEFTIYNIASGLYLVRVMAGDYSTVVKLVIK